MDRTFAERVKLVKENDLLTFIENGLISISFYLEIQSRAITAITPQPIRFIRLDLESKVNLVPHS